MTPKDRKKAIEKLTDHALINHAKEMEEIHKRITEDMELIKNEISKRAHKVIIRQNKE